MLGYYLLQLRGYEHLYNLDCLPDGVEPDFGDHIYHKNYNKGIFEKVGNVQSFAGQVEMIKGYPHVEIRLLAPNDLPEDCHHLLPTLTWNMSEEQLKKERYTKKMLYNGSKILAAKQT
jgi:hypothetical protein